MQAINYTTLRNKLKEYCDMACDRREDIIVTRKKERHVVLMSLENYNRIKKKISGEGSDSM